MIWRSSPTPPPPTHTHTHTHTLLEPDLRHWIRDYVINIVTTPHQDAHYHQVAARAAVMM